MKKLILVRYGQHENGHLTPEGVATMTIAGERLRLVTEGKDIAIITSKSPRALESAKVIAEILNVGLTIDDALYAAEEDGIFPDNAKAKVFLNKLGEEVDLVIAVSSREYIETLPGYILGNDLHTHLNRGECLIIDYESNSVSYLKDTN